MAKARLIGKMYWI